MIQPGRKYASSSSKYRYSINGQEKNVELNENITTAEYWEYDSRIARRWNTDPKSAVSNSPYFVFSGNPIYNSDPLGDSSEPGAKKVLHNPGDNTGYAPNGDLIQMGPSNKLHVVFTNLGSKDKEDFRITYFFVEGQNGGWSWNTQKKAFINSKGEEFSNGLATAIFNKLNPGRNLSEAVENVINGEPLKDVRQSYSQYKASGGRGYVPGFIFSGISGSMQNWWEDMGAGGNRGRDAWIGLWNFSARIAEGGAFSTSKSFDLLSFNSGNGPLGKDGLKLGNYRFDLLYRNPASGIGHGTLISIKEMRPSGNFLRWDFGTLHQGGVGWHSSFRFSILGRTYGSTAQRSVFAPFVFFKYPKK